MKKRIFSCLLAAVLLFGAAGFSFIKEAPRAQAATDSSPEIYVAKNEAAGLYGDVLSVNISGTRYGLFLPGSADVSRLFLAWSEETTVTDNLGTVLVSGQVSLPASGQALFLKINGDSLSFITYQGSTDVRAMFLETDETLDGFDSFEEMNSDPNKEIETAGTMSFGSDTGYYFSMKGRGNSNWYSAKKKPYNITLYKDNTYDKKLSAELIDGVEAKKWTLTANYYDDSLLRNKVGYDMALALGIGLSSDFVDLYVDGQYLGNYLLTPKNDYQAPDEGFIVEIDNWFDDEDHQFTLDGMNEYHPTWEGSQHRITVKDNGAGLPNEEIESYMQAAWNSLLDEESDEYLKYIDLDSWAKYYLLHEYYKSFDVVCGSIIMHRDGTSESDKLIAGPVWDLDNSMGRVQENVDLGLSQQEQHSPEGWYIQNVYDPEPWENGDLVDKFWLQQLGKHESFMERVYALYWEYKSVFDGAAAALEQDITRLTASAKMNHRLPGACSGRPAMVGTDACGCSTTSEWLNFADNLLNYVQCRSAFFAANMPTVEGAGPAPTIPNTSVPATSVPATSVPAGDLTEDPGNSVFLFLTMIIGAVVAGGLFIKLSQKKK